MRASTFSHSQPNFTQFNELVGAIYDEIDQETPWVSFLQTLTSATGSRDASIVMCSPCLRSTSYNLATSDVDPRLTREYLDDVFSVNMVIDLPQPQPNTIEELITPAEFKRSRLYKQFLQPYGIEYMLGVDFLNNDDLHIKLAINRTEEQGQFNQQDKDLLAHLVPHFQRAVRLRDKNHTGSSLRSLYLDTIAKMAIGSVILDGKGNILYTNSSADELLSAQRGLKNCGGKLCTTEDVRTSKLRDAINLALAAHHNNCRAQKGQGFRLHSDTGGYAMDVVVKPLFTDIFQTSPQVPSAIVYVHECRDSSIALEPTVLEKIYGFTNREAAISSLLARGASIAEAADTLEVSTNTVKTHLRGIYEKMGTKKQAQLVARLNESCARFL